MLPTIDLLNLSNDGQDISSAAKSLDQALHQSGFAYIKNHGIDQQIVASAFDSSQKFHQLELSEKNRIAINSAHRGYMGLASSTIVTSSVETATRPNQSESLLILNEVEPEHFGGTPLSGPNQWPDSPADFKKNIQKFESATKGLCEYLTGILEVALHCPSGQLQQHFTHATTFLRLLHYPPQPVSSDTHSFGSAPHTDYGFITIVNQDNTGGLQVQNEKGEWMDVSPKKDHLVVNVGDMGEIWSNGRWQSTRHRVRNTVQKHRYSIVYFYDPNFETQVEPITESSTGKNKQSENYGEYLMHRLDANYDYRSGED